MTINCCLRVKPDKQRALMNGSSEALNHNPRRGML